MVFCPAKDYLRAMNSLVSLASCLDRALAGLPPVPAASVPTARAAGLLPAQDLCLPHDMPPASQALRAGFAVAALDLVGAGAGTPLPLATPAPVVPGQALPPGTDAVLTEDGIEMPTPGWPEAIRPVGPGEGVRRAGHDGRAGDVIAAAGTRLAPRHIVIAAQAGIAQIACRRPRVAIALQDGAQAGFARGWFTGLGACVVDDLADLTLRTATDHTPRLALDPAQSAWLARGDAGLVLTLPVRLDGMVAGCLALALPALARLTGAAPLVRTLPLARKVASTVGLSDLVLLTEQAGHWQPQPPGMLTLTGLASASAFAILPPDSEGLPGGAPLAATPFDMPFG